MLFLVGCTHSQHIRKKDYYHYDWGILGLYSDQKEALDHHPIFAHIDSFSKEGKASYSKNLNYFLFGLFPFKHSVSLKEACEKKPFRQAYSYHNFWQATISLVSLGIYTPRTLEVWCGKVKL